VPLMCRAPAGSSGRSCASGSGSSRTSRTPTTVKHPSHR